MSNPDRLTSYVALVLSVIALGASCYVANRADTRNLLVTRAAPTMQGNLGSLMIRGPGIPDGTFADFQPHQEAQGPSTITNWNTDNVITLQQAWPRCQIVLSPAGRVTLTDCQDADDAARTFWKAVEQNWPCKGEARP
jgi:glucose dehydrogenase